MALTDRATGTTYDYCPQCGCCLCDNRQCGGDGLCGYCCWEPGDEIEED